MQPQDKSVRGFRKKKIEVLVAEGNFLVFVSKSIKSNIGSSRFLPNVS